MLFNNIYMHKNGNKEKLSIKKASFQLLVNFLFKKKLVNNKNLKTIFY